MKTELYIVFGSVVSHGDKILQKSDNMLQTHYATKIIKRKTFSLAGGKRISPFVYIITLVDWSTFDRYLFIYFRDSSYKHRVVSPTYSQQKQILVAEISAAWLIII